MSRKCDPGCACGLHKGNGARARNAKHGNPAARLTSEQRREISRKGGLTHSAEHLRAMTLSRNAKHGNPMTGRTGEKHPRWKGDVAGYEYWLAHTRKREQDGPAREHVCVDCGGLACDWSHDHGDPDERVTADGFTYSLDLSFYSARCRSCHKGYDNRRPARRRDYQRKGLHEELAA